MATAKPFNLKQWIEDNKHLLQPPVANKNLYVDSGDYIVNDPYGSLNDGYTGAVTNFARIDQNNYFATAATCLI